MRSGPSRRRAYSSTIDQLRQRGVSAQLATEIPNGCVHGHCRRNVLSQLARVGRFREGRNEIVNRDSRFIDAWMCMPVDDRLDFGGQGWKHDGSVLEPEHISTRFHAISARLDGRDFRAFHRHVVCDTTLAKPLPQEDVVLQSRHTAREIRRIGSVTG